MDSVWIVELGDTINIMWKGCVNQEDGLLGNKSKKLKRESMLMIVEIEFLVIESNCLNGHAEQ